MFPEKKLALLAEQGGNVKARDVIRLFRFTKYTWQRATRRPGFPALAKIGRIVALNAEDFVRWARLENAIEKGITVSQCARETRHSVGFLQTLIKRGEFVPALGTYRGHDRFDLDGVREWKRERATITHAPPDLHVPDEHNG